MNACCNLNTEQRVSESLCSNSNKISTFFNNDGMNPGWTRNKQTTQYSGNNQNLRNSCQFACQANVSMCAMHDTCGLVCSEKVREKSHTHTYQLKHVFIFWHNAELKHTFTVGRRGEDSKKEDKKDVEVKNRSNILTWCLILSVRHSILY